MSHSTPAPTWRRRNHLRLVMALFVAVAGMLATSSLAGAAPKPPPTTTVITVDNAFDQSLTVVTPGDQIPVRAAAGSSYVVAGSPFDVNFSSNLPLSTSRDTHVVLTVTTGGDAGAVTGSTDVPAGETTGTIAGVTLPTAGNNVQIQVAVDERRTLVVPGTMTLDVLSFSHFAPQSSALTGIGGGGTTGVECHPTSSEPICGDLVLPNPDGVASDQLVSQGCSGACSTHGSYVQAIVRTTAAYDRSHPFEVVFKCDKTLCPGKAIKNYVVKVELVAGSGAVTSLPCPAKGVIGTNQAFCTDYVQSTRDNAGDVLLHVELQVDAKIIW